MDKPARSWMFAALLTLPMIALYAGYLLNHSPDLLPTGFIVYDNVSYVAYAKQLVEQPGFQLTYANPFNDGGHYPAIYFQPQTLVYALMLKAKMDSGWCIILFNLLGTLLSFRMVIALYDFLFPSQKGRLLFISLFCWGGGLLALAGVPVAAFKQIENLDFSTAFSSWTRPGAGGGSILDGDIFLHRKGSTIFCSSPLCLTCLKEIGESHSSWRCCSTPRIRLRALHFFLFRCHGCWPKACSCATGSFRFGLSFHSLDSPCFTWLITLFISIIFRSTNP